MNFFNIFKIFFAFVIFALLPIYQKHIATFKLMKSKNTQQKTTVQN